MPRRRAAAALSIAVSLLLAALLAATAAPEVLPRRAADAARPQPAARPTTPAPDATPAAILALPRPPAPTAVAALVPAPSTGTEPTRPTPLVPRGAAPSAAPGVEPLKPRSRQPSPPPPAPSPSPRPPLQPAATAAAATATTAAAAAPAKTADAAEPVEPRQPAGAVEPAVGRALLRMLEHGRGPGLEIAWPDRPGERERLYRNFQRCYGMRLALQDGTGRLFVDAPPARIAWRPNGDRYSGFARLSTGRLTAAERRDIGAIARRHGLAPALSAVRVFPRALDAHLLGSLQQLIGGEYLQAKAIRASYRLRQGRVLVGDVSVDGVPRDGVVDLSAALARRCGSG